MSVSVLLAFGLRSAIDVSLLATKDAEPAAPDDWELDAVEIKFQDRIASGAFGDLYKGTYCGQDVAIKILRNVQDDSQQYAEFLQVRHTWTCFVGLSTSYRAGCQTPMWQLRASGTVLHVRCRIDTVVRHIRWRGERRPWSCCAGSVHHEEGASQECGAVHWRLHPQAQPVHRCGVHARRLGLRLHEAGESVYLSPPLIILPPVNLDPAFVSTHAAMHPNLRGGSLLCRRVR